MDIRELVAQLRDNAKKSQDIGKILFVGAIANRFEDLQDYVDQLEDLLVSELVITLLGRFTEEQVKVFEKAETNYMKRTYKGDNRG